MKVSSALGVDSCANGTDPMTCYKVVIVYDHLDSALRAKAVFDRLISRFGSEMSFCCDYWRLDVLNHPEAYLQAEGTLTAADLIIIAAHDVSKILQERIPWAIAATQNAACLLLQLQTIDNSIEWATGDFFRPIASGMDFALYELEPLQSVDSTFRDQWPPVHRVDCGTA